MEDCTFIVTLGRDGATVECDDFFCDGKSEAEPAGAGGAGFVQPEKLFKNPFQLLGRNDRSLILKRKGYGRVVLANGNPDFRIRITVGNGVFQNIAENPCQTVRIAIDGLIFCHVQADIISMFLKKRVKLIGQLNQQIIKVNGFFFQNSLLQAI